MKKKSLTLLLSSGVIMLSAVSLHNAPATANSTRFFCGSNQGVPVTYASTPRGNVPVVRWKSNYFSRSGYTPQRRCDEVASRLQTYHSNGKLEYITAGIMNGQPVVCVSSSLGGRCQGLLLTLRPKDRASRVIQQLFDIRSGASGPIQQSSSRPYINFQELLDNRPVDTSPLPEVTPSTSPGSQNQQPTNEGLLW
ncbi:MAG: hypothetical protein F6K61_20440 [Sphaerospermopsis sp. SIO1G1]|nr:hypothetical protein [Sphaerospermopsis sp. SIO1G1]